MRALTREEVFPLVRAHGRHSLAYSVLQPGMGYWGEVGRVAIAFRVNLGQVSVLGDPLCAPEYREDFLRAAVERFPNALFMQISAHTAAILRGMGRPVTPVGVENEIDTGTFTLAGKAMADLRHYRNKAAKGGVVVEERTDDVALRAALLPVSRAWLPRKSFIGRELEFLARPFQLAPEPGTRIFVGTAAGRLLAFVVLDPMYDAGEVRGYVVTILRHVPDAPEGTVDAIVLRAILRLAEEGVPLLSLGVSPFYRLDALGEEYGRGSAPVYHLYRALYRWGNPIYHFRGLSFHKSRYRARTLPVFTSVPRWPGLLPLYASARACRML